MSDRLFSPSQREGFGRPFSDAVLVYIGDDDKDVQAFEVVHSLGGTNILVSELAQINGADYVLKSPNPYANGFWIYFIRSK